MMRETLGLTVALTVAFSACATVPGAQSRSGTTPGGAVAATPPSVGDTAAETKVRAVVEGFGKKLQDVSLQAPDAAQVMQEQYSEYISPALLDAWMNDVVNAPGRIVSSPWPDRIEISALEQTGADRYVVSGFIVEVTSVEVLNGEAAAKLPVQLTVERQQGQWLITEFSVRR
jgi:hypothetical protein